MALDLVSHSMPPLLQLLADEVRWHLVKALAYSDRRGQELVALVRRPQNLVSYHLKQLLRGKVIVERRSTADRRAIYYSLDVERLRALYAEIGHSLHPALSRPDGQPEATTTGARPARVLFHCTHNSARSQMAEAILRHLGQGQVEAYSAGNEPSAIHPLAIQAMRERGISLEGQRAKHVSEFIGQRFDYIVTVCDVARESCPVFPGDPEQIHWSFPDPAAVADREARERAFSRTATELTTRINYLLLVINRQRQEGQKP